MDDGVKFGFRRPDGVVVGAVCFVEFDNAPHAFLADDKAVLSSQVIGGNDIAGEHIVVDKGAVIDGNNKPRS